MRSHIIVLVAMAFVIGSSCQAQSGWEKSAWVAGSVVVLGVYDYIGYNLTSSNPTALGIYRITFFLVQAGLTYLLYEKFGLPSAIGFNLIWWTFGVDMVYYGICEVNPSTDGNFAGRGSWAADTRDGIEHAEWTPVGIVRPGDRIPGDTVAGQSIVGAAIGIAITITF